MLKIPFDLDQVHLFTIAGKKFALDINSGTFLELDDLMWDALVLGSAASCREELMAALSTCYSRAVASEGLAELELLTTAGHLFTPDHWAAHSLPESQGVATLCVNLSQACNLRCKYCFAGDGSYGMQPTVMKLNTAQRTVDFFLEHAGKYNDLSLCFFGGEPLLNYATMQKTVEYALAQTEHSEKSFRFNITTNGTLLNQAVRKYLRDHKFGVIVSIDGDREAHNAMRPFANGQGSYDQIRENLDAFQEECQDEDLPWTLRATFSRQQANLCDRVSHLASLGFQDISVEPCISSCSDLGIKEADVTHLKAEYDTLAKHYLAASRNGPTFNFFHFRVMMEQARSGTLRLTQCGAGRGYLAVSAEGHIYPCHRLIGQEDYRMGDIFAGITHPEIRQLFDNSHVNAKPLCRDCWARYICGGGCHACAIQFNLDISQPYEVECELIKHRIKLGAYLYSELGSGNGNLPTG